MTPRFLLLLLAPVVGALIAVQAAANAALSKALGGNVPFASLSLIAVAGAAMLLAIILSGARPPSAVAFSTAPPWAYVGGVIVAFYVVAITFLAPRLGVGAAITLVVTGQILGGMLVDHFGLLRSTAFPVTAPRLVGAGLMVIGAFLALRR